MTKRELTDALNAAKDEYREGLQTIWDNTNKGQRNKMLKNEQIKAILDRFGVVTEE
jgi:hypothetical protein